MTWLLVTLAVLILVATVLLMFSIGRSAAAGDRHTPPGSRPRSDIEQIYRRCGACHTLRPQSELEADGELWVCIDIRRCSETIARQPRRARR